jgi:hypothetical protein
MTFVPEPAQRRNAQMSPYPLSINHLDPSAEPPLTSGGRVVHRRMQWASTSLCNAVAALAGYAEISH